MMNKTGMLASFYWENKRTHVPGKHVIEINNILLLDTSEEKIVEKNNNPKLQLRHTHIAA